MAAFLGRNCPKYYPQDLKNRPHCWTPAYEGSQGLQVYLEDRAIPQCPTGYVTPEAKAWVQQYLRMKTSIKATNSPYFASLDQADPVELEMFNIFERESQHVEHEQSAARARR